MESMRGFISRSHEDRNCHERVICQIVDDVAMEATCKIQIICHKKNQQKLNCSSCDLKTKL